MNLHRSVVETSEREKQAVAVVLHDGLAQSLTALSVLARIVANRLKRASMADIAEITVLQETIDNAMDETRLLIRDLKPPDFAEDGLIEALCELTAAVSKKVPCRLESRAGICIPDPAVALGLFRIAQEAVRHAVQHARASRITVSIHSHESFCTLEISSEGITNSPSLVNAGLQGLAIIQSHAVLIGAALDTEQTATGYRVTCAVPLRSLAL
jgi:signal transduction histidine kinase